VKLGRQAQKVYEQVVRDFGDQPAAAQARSRLAALRLAGGRTLPATMTQRKLPPRTYSDGQRELRQDDPTASLTIGDFAGKEKHVIIKPKTGDSISAVMPSHDISMVLMQSDSTHKWAGGGCQGEAVSSNPFLRGSRAFRAREEPALDSLYVGRVRAV